MVLAAHLMVPQTPLLFGDSSVQVESDNSTTETGCQIPHCWPYRNGHTRVTQLSLFLRQASEVCSLSESSYRNHLFVVGTIKLMDSVVKNKSKFGHLFVSMQSIKFYGHLEILSRKNAVETLKPDFTVEPKISRITVRCTFVQSLLVSAQTLATTLFF